MSSGKYTVSEDWDLELATSLFRDIRGVEASAQRFRWLYCENPVGPARVWILHDPANEPVGFTAAHPRQVWVDGRNCCALNCGDFSVAVGHRSLGPAAILRRPAKILVDSGQYAFLYAHPVPAMLAVHLRVGHPQVGRMVRWIHPLRADDFVARRFGRAAGRLVGPALTLGLRGRRWLNERLYPAGVTTREVREFSPDYDDLDWQLAQHYRVIGRRNRSYLAWRFQERPGLEVSTIEARNAEGNLLGYLVLELAETCRAHDVAYVPNRGVEAALWSHALSRASKAGGHSLNVTVHDCFPGIVSLQRAGFWKRDEDQTTVCYGGTDFGGKTTVENAVNWFMTIGDRDV